MGRQCGAEKIDFSFIGRLKTGQLTSTGLELGCEVCSLSARSLLFEPKGIV